MLRCPLCLLVLAVSPLFAQQGRARPDTTLLAIQPGQRDASEESRLAVYELKHLPASDVGATIEKSMGGEITVISEPLGNRLLIRGTDSKLQEAQALLKMLDQPPKMIAFDILFADLPALADDAKPPDGQTSDEAWLARLKQEKENGKSKANISKVRLTAMDNQLSSVQFGEQTAVVTGVQAFGGGRERPGRTAVTQQRQFGTLVQCTARVSGDDTIIAELQIERSKIAPPEDATLLEESDDAGALRAPGMLTTTCKTTLKLKPGRPRVISGLKSQGPGKGTESVIVITAEMISP